MVPTPAPIMMHHSFAITTYYVKYPPNPVFPEHPPPIINQHRQNYKLLMNRDWALYKSQICKPFLWPFMPNQQVIFG